MSRIIFLTTCLALLVLAGQRVSHDRSLAALSNPGYPGEFSGQAAPPAEPLSLWYRQPAREFTQALPLANGRLGAAVFGGVDEERLVLNEGTLWSGGPQDADKPDAAQYLPEIRRLLLAGKNAEAEKLVYANFTCQGQGSGRGHGWNNPYGSYQMLGNLRLEFANVPPEVRNYRRSLNLAEAVARVEYEQGGAHLRRETFVSAADPALVMRLSADQPGQFTFAAKLERPERATLAAKFQRVNEAVHNQQCQGDQRQGVPGGHLKCDQDHLFGRCQIEGEEQRARHHQKQFASVTRLKFVLFLFLLRRTELAARQQGAQGCRQGLQGHFSNQLRARRVET
jgi:hypothetical protein